MHWHVVTSANQDVKVATAIVCTLTIPHPDSGLFLRLAALADDLVDNGVHSSRGNGHV